MTDDLRIRIHAGDKDALRAAAEAAGVPMAVLIRERVLSGVPHRPVLTVLIENILSGRIQPSEPALISLFREHGDAS